MTPDSAVECAAVVLAAGAARRFGGPKLLMPFGQSTVIGTVIDALAAAGVAPIIVVAGANAADIRKALAGGDVQVVVNPSPDDGMLSSVQIGIAALPETQRFLIALGDQPRIRPDDVRRLVGEHALGGKDIALPLYDGRRGHPVVFSAGCRAEILALAGARTLRDVTDAHREDTIEVELESDAYVRDIDTREEYEHELRQWRAER